MKNLSIFGAAGVVALAGSAFAGTPIVDGSRDAVYGSPLALQTVQTQFGDSNNGQVFGNGNELNGLYATADNDNLYVLLTGNMSGDNAITFFFENTGIAPGTNVLPNISGSIDDFFASADSYGGTTMSAGFAPQRGYMWKYFDFPNDNVPDFIGCLANFPAATADNGTNGAFTTGPGANPGISPVFSLGTFNGFQVAINGANTAGVTSGDGPFSDPVATAAVSTGMEFQIPLSALGLVPGAGHSVKILAVLSGGSFNFGTFISNQTLPPLPTPQGNLGVPDNAATKAIIGSIAPATYVLPAANVADWMMY